MMVSTFPGDQYLKLQFDIVYENLLLTHIPIFLGKIELSKSFNRTIIRTLQFRSSLSLVINLSHFSRKNIISLSFIICPLFFF